MTLKKLLNDIRDLISIIEFKKLKLQRSWSQTLYPGISYEPRVQSDKDHNKHSDDILEIMELEDEIKKLKQKLAKMLKQVKQATSDMTEKEQLIIKLRYIKGKTWEDVAKEIGHSKRWTLEINKKLIEKLEKKV